MTPQGGLDARACFYRCFNSMLLSTVSEHREFGVAKFLYSFGQRVDRPVATMAHSSVRGHLNSSGLWITSQLPFLWFISPLPFRASAPLMSLCTQIQIGNILKLFFNLKTPLDKWFLIIFVKWFFSPNNIIHFVLSLPVSFQIADRKCLVRQHTWRFLAERAPISSIKLVTGHSSAADPLHTFWSGLTWAGWKKNTTVDTQTIPEQQNLALP